MIDDKNEFEYIEYISKRVSDRAVKQVRGYLSKLKEEMDFVQKDCQRLYDRIQQENRRTLDIRSQFHDLDDILTNMKSEKEELFKRFLSYEQSYQNKFNRLTDLLIEANELGALLKLKSKFTVSDDI